MIHLYLNLLYSSLTQDRTLWEAVFFTLKRKYQRRKTILGTQGTPSTCPFVKRIFKDFLRKIYEWKMKQAGAELCQAQGSKIYYCRLVRLGLWEPVHNKPCKKIFHNKLCRKHYKTLWVGKYSTTSIVETILKQSWWETFYNKLSGIIFE